MTKEIKRLSYLKDKVLSLPELPGVYQFWDQDQKILYIGKAKNLRKRVASYFVKVHEYGKTRVLVAKIHEITHLVVSSEEDALLLENNLIKKYQPRYNILLKDDKSFPWIVVRNEPFPRIYQTRQFVKDGSSYFGPYTSGGFVRALLELFRQLYPIRTCSLNLSPEYISKGKYRVCLEYHLGNCLAPCIGAQREEEYDVLVDQIRAILKGNIQLVIRHLKEQMQHYAQLLDFEKAEIVKQKLKRLEGFQLKSTVVNHSIGDLDVFSLLEEEDRAFVNFLRVVNGSIVQSHTMEFRKKLEESGSEILSFAISEIRERNQFLARELIVPFLPDCEWNSVRFTIPKSGDKFKLLELSERNVKYYRLEQLKQQAIKGNVTPQERVLKTLQSDLGLRELPVHIECFDNSNIQGAYPVAACVVFKNGRPSKKDYRHFHIKTVEGPNDFASMEEVIGRRYARLLEEGDSLPQLIIVDGGKGQLSMATRVLEKFGLLDRIAIIGIAKRLEEIFYPYDAVPLYLDKVSESLKLIQFLRNEAHRFGISFHRNVRSRNFIQSELDKIKGIGPQSADALLQTFKHITGVKEATLDSLTSVLGASKGKLVYHYFHPLFEE